jgi:hypothetical protein
MFVPCQDVRLSLAAAIFGFEALTHWWWLLAYSAVTVISRQLCFLAGVVISQCQVVAQSRVGAGAPDAHGCFMFENSGNWYQAVTALCWQALCK